MSRTANQTRRKLELRRRLALAPWTETLEPRQLLASFQVFDPGDTNTSGTLRYAINQVNADANDSPSAPDVISFNLPGSGQQTITLTSPLPAITNPVIIDGYTQSGSAINRTAVGLDEQETDLAVLNVRIDGSGVAPTAAAPGMLTVIASNTTIDGLSLTNFNGPAIALLPPPNSPTGSVGDDIWGNFIGVTSFDPNALDHNDLPLDPSNPPADPNAPFGSNVWTHDNPTGNTVGILVQSSNNRIGGSLPPSRNVIQGNHGDGVQLTTVTGIGNLVEGNYILDNDANGVYITTSNNLIGEAIGQGPAGAGNVISGNNYGVAIVGPAATGNILVNNEIGTEIGRAKVLPQERGLNPRPNRYDGVYIQDAPGNIVGGQIANSRNVIAANGRDGVSIQNVNTTGATGNIVEGNYIGFNIRSGLISILPNRDGINISSANNTIGGTVLAARNEIAGNARNGITITSMTLDSSNLNPVAIPNADPTGNFVAGNFIGTEGGGDDYGNTYDGVLIEDAGGNSVGGSTSGAANVISGNNDGVVINDDTAGHAASTGNIVSGNVIGLMSDNRTPLPNSVDGVLVINASNNTIGGTVTAADNVLSGNNNGLHLTGAFATSNVVIGNFVGTDITGTFAARNSVDGILIDNGAYANTIGGTSTATRNIISGNGTGVAIMGTVPIIRDPNTNDVISGNVVEGNYIGVAADGKTALPNAQAGVNTASNNNTVGGTVAAAANVISGNFVGVYLTGASTTANVVEGNLVGTDATGANAVKNTTDGVLLDGGAFGNTIGGASAVGGNIIADNGGNGVNVAAGTGNSILSNEIFSNGLLGIAGSNGQLSAFTITSVSPGLTNTVITFQFTSTGPAGPFLFQFFINQPNASAGYNYEGQAEIASQTENANGTFTVTVPSVLTTGQYVTFTGTGPDGTTSEFSAGVPVGAGGSQPLVYTVTNTLDDGSQGSLRWAIDQVNQNPSPLPTFNDKIVFAIPGTGQQTINLLSPLPAILYPVAIEGYTQPGSQPNTPQISTVTEQGSGGSASLTTVVGTGLSSTLTRINADGTTTIITTTVTGFNGVLNVRLDGSQILSRPPGAEVGLLTVQSLNVQVSGLSITGYKFGPALLLDTGGATNFGGIGDTIFGNVIGESSYVKTNNTSTPQSNPLGNLEGIVVRSPNNVIGGEVLNIGVPLPTAVASEGYLSPPAVGANVIQGNDGPGLVFEGPHASGNIVGANFVLDNQQDGVFINNASNNFIGQASVGLGNIISGNGANGIEISGSAASGDVVVNNLIGTDPDTDSARPNLQNGVLIVDAPGNIIGGLLPASPNVIGSNAFDGVSIQNGPAQSAVGNVVEGNSIGFNPHDLGGVVAILPNRDGINISAADNIVGGTTVGAGNDIAFNWRNGITIAGVTLDAHNVPAAPIANANPTGNLVQGNLVGTLSSGITGFGIVDEGNTLDGILIDDASANSIGGTVTSARNVISGNNRGVVIIDDTANHLAATANLVLGNYIGTMADGVTVLNNAVEGVRIENAAGNTIGGTTAAAANVISGNNFGVHLTGASASGNIVEGNLIGTDFTGTVAVRNSLDGVLIDTGAAGNTIGGVASTAANVIAFNVRYGVNVGSNGNSILSNEIFSNGLLGINFPGTTTYLNTYQVVSALADAASNSTVINVQLASPAQAPFLLQLFGNPANGSPSYNYEGQTLLATQPVTTNGSSPTSFTIVIPSVLAVGQRITFTATAADGSTSHFSAGVAVVAAAQPATFTVTNANDSGPGSLRDAVAQVDAATNLLPGFSDKIVFAIPFSGQQTISLLSPLFITNPVKIDGFSQPGSSPNSLGVGFNGVYNVRLDGQYAVLDPTRTATYPVQGLLTVAAINTQITGLSITGYMNGPAILLAPAAAGGNTVAGDTVSGNLIGVAALNPNLSAVPPTSSPFGNLVGIEVQSSGNLIGGSVIGAGNVIEANNGVGLQLDGPSGTGNVVDANAIVNNLGDGILIRSANNVIGEEIAPATNLIAGNGGNGIDIQGTAAKGNVVSFNGGANILVVSSPTSGIVGNFVNGVLIQDAPGTIIETNDITGNVGDGVRVLNGAAGTATDNHILNNDIESNRDGVNISSSNNDVSQLNTIIFNRRNGVTISSTDLDANNNLPPGGGALANNQASGNVVAGNDIGTFAGGDDNGNTLEGVLINAAPNNTIGGLNADDRNIISGNNDGVVIRGPASVGNLLENNVIGAKGVTIAVLPNAVDGVRIENAGNNTIGGVGLLGSNEISGNNTGIHLTGAGTTNNVVQNNYIGTDFLVGSPVRNSNNGILFDNNASNNTIGGTASGTANTIAFNVGSGVAVASGTGNAFLDNSIFSNDRIGIDLVAPGDPADGVTPQQLVPTPGPNDLVNAPVIGFASSDGKNHTSVVGTFLGVSGGTYLLQFFSSPTADPTGYGQGQTYLGSTSVTVTGSNPSQLMSTGFDAELKVNVPAGQLVTATATELSGSGTLVYGSTSEFSNVMPTASVSLGFSATSYTVDQAAGTATITVTRGGSPTATQGLVSVDYAVGGGTAVPGTNYVPTSGTLTFNPGDVAKTIVIPIINNPAVAPSTTVNVTLSNPTGAATINDPNPVTLTITNNNVASIQFSVASYAANENGGTATITVTRNTANGSATVNYATSNATANAGVDYTPVSGTLSFGPGQTSQTFTVPILDAGKVGGSTTLNLTLSGASGAALGSPSTATLNITDNDHTGALEFNNVSYGVNASASSALVTIVRNGGTGGTVSVQYATGGGTAVPGQDYAPTSGVLTFGPGETIKSFSIPILNHNHFGNYTVGLTLSAPGGGASLGPIAGATLNISQNAGATLVKAGPQPGPVVTNFVLNTNGPAITGLVFSFNEPLDPTRASNPANYGSYIVTAGRDNLFGTGDDGGVLIASASYNPATFQVILTPAAPLALGQLYKIGINTLASVQLQTGLTDTQGNLLDGVYDGHSGSPYVATFALGSQIHYLDGSGNFVTLQLNRGGFLQLQAAGNGNAELVRVIGAVPGKSQLTGSVRGHRRASTTIPFIQGAGGVRVRLPRSQFHVGQISAAAVDHILARHGRH